MTLAEQRQAARKFAEKWKERGREKADSQPFWLALLRDVYDVKQPEDVISFEDTVMLDHTSFIDGYLPATNVLVEQKSRGKNLDAPIKQSDGSLLTPFQQAKRYSAELPYSKRPRWIVTSNFEEFRVYDMERPNDPAEIVKLADLEREVHRLQFLVQEQSEHIRREMEVSLEAGEIVGIIYDALSEQYADMSDSESQHSLNVLCVRLVFCLYAESAGIFGRYGMFGEYLNRHKDNARDALIKLFQVLDTPESERDRYLDDDLAEFPYVNGGLFRGNIEIPRITSEIAYEILYSTSDGFNWRDISPTIFGAIFESTLNAETRHEGGMHYTSVENIHKVIDPLFLDDLRAELDSILAEYKTARGRRPRLDAFRDKLASLTFLDPACGSGNFLTETYLSLRRLENDAIHALTQGQIQFGSTNPIRVSIEQFHGIEINDFAVTVAQTALWIAEAQMLQETESILNMQIEYLPLTTAAHILQGNALRLEWNDVVPKQDVNYIFSNPPYLGYSDQNDEQKSDMQAVYVAADGTPLRNAGKIDYVAGWFYKSAQYMYGTDIRTALVATNSVTMGDQVAPIWEPLRRQFGTHIDFAWRTFRWDSEATDPARVHVVIVGFSDGAKDKEPRFLSETGATPAENINAYLIDGPDVLISSRRKPICAVPEMRTGNRPADGGALIIEERDYPEFVKRAPDALPFIKRLVGGDEYIKGKDRWCLWLVDATPKELNAIPAIRERLERCRENRLAGAPDRQKLAETPALFREIQNPETFVLIPATSSEKRRYIPMGFLDAESIPSNAALIVPDATLYDFGVLTSNVHMAWMRVVAGRLESRYRYSKDIVYNNFPWPDPTPEQKAKIERTAQAIIDARAKYPDSSLANLYKEATMPTELRKAHQENDKAVMLAYGFRENGHWLSEPETVARLMQMYVEMTTKNRARS